MARAGLRPGNGAAKLLLRLRLILAGEGVLREGRGIFRVSLPRSRNVIELDDREGSACVIVEGKPASRPLDLRDEMDFVALMHAVDFSIAASEQVPVPLLRLADEYARAMGQGDELLASLVSCENLEFPAREGDWRPPATLYALCEAARRSDDPRLSDAAEAALGDPESAERFCVAESKARWGELVERWQNPDGVSFPAGSGTWVRFVTRAGVAAVASRLDLALGQVLTIPGTDARVPIERAEVYVLYDEAGDVGAVATVVEGGIGLRRSAETGDLDEATAILSERLGIASPARLPGL